MRRSTQPAISLFAFQDIITAVSGILVLMTLLLAMDLTEPRDAAHEAMDESADELQTQLVDLNTEIRRVSQELDESGELARRAAENPRSQLQRKIKLRKSSIESEQSRLTRLQKSSKELDRAERQAKTASRQAADNEQQLEELQEEVESLETQLTRLENGSTSRYATPEGIGGDEGWLCEVTAGGLKLMRIDSPDDSRVIPVSDLYLDGKQLLSRLKNWIESETPRPKYLLFLLRPDGSAFMDVINAELPGLGIEYATDLIAADHVIAGADGQ